MFFIRRYVKGNHQSGTKNVFEWDERPSIMDFINTCESVGEGKYVLFERGVGIRGMRKINEYTVNLSEIMSRVLLKWLFLRLKKWVLIPIQF